MCKKKCKNENKKNAPNLVRLKHNEEKDKKRKKKEKEAHGPYPPLGP